MSARDIALSGLRVLCGVAVSRWDAVQYVLGLQVDQSGEGLLRRAENQGVADQLRTPRNRNRRAQRGESKEEMMDTHDVMLVLNDPVTTELLQSPLLAHLAYTGPDGFPRVVPIGYLWNGNSFVMCTAPMAPKVAALKQNPRVALSVDSNTEPPHVLLVRGTADLEIIDGVPAEYLDASKKSFPPEQWAPFEAQVRGVYKQMAS